ncbi:MAG: class I adenylate-forming enzyme family protein [Candidatus Hermodarchaeia archaeon]|jgi:fatty-acyl-CoA synthase
MMNINPPEDWQWIGDWLGRRAALTPDHEALLDPVTERRYSYAELNDRGNQLANLLSTKYSIKKGDRVAFLLHNRIECIDAFSACGKLGAILVPLNVRLTPAEHQEYLANITSTILFYEGAFDKTINDLRHNVPSLKHFLAVDITSLKNSQSYQQLLSNQSTTPPPRPSLGFEDPFFILPTGGTTGLPKGAVLSHRHIFWNSVNTIVCWGLSPNDVCPIIFPLYHTGGWNVLLIPLFHVGARVILWRQFDAVDTLRRIEEERCTIIIGVPTMYHMMIKTPAFTKTDFSSVRFWLSGGAPCPVSIMEHFWNRDQEFAMGYGLTEVGPNNFYMPHGASKKKPTAVGLPFFHNAVRVVNDELEDVPPGEVGELLLRGPHAFSGYWKNPQATQDVFETDGWIHTGDLARQDTNGFFYIAGRKKELFISGGENVFPIEIERVLDEHPAVDQAAVVGMPDEKWGEVGCAYIVLKKGAKVLEKELVKFMRSKLARYKVPKRIVIIDELPKTSAGKIAKRELEKQALDFIKNS